MSARSPWRADATWERRLARDAERIRSVLPARLAEVHQRVVDRAHLRAMALLLTGSTARRRRTAISDLDYHLIGEPIETGDLPEEVDMHVVSSDELQRRLSNGDDFTQWSLRFGLVVLDDGIVRESMRRIAEDRLWPDVERKREQARRSLRTAEAMVASQDRDAALDQVRTALTLIARWRLLSSGAFPLSRAELPRQLAQIGDSPLAEALTTTIHNAPSLGQLERMLPGASELLDHPLDARVARPRARAA
jgi:hypothetical protein